MPSRWPLCFSRRQCHILLLHDRWPTPLSLLLSRLGATQYCYGLQGMHLHPRASGGRCIVAASLPHVPHVYHPQDKELAQHRLILYSSDDPRKKANAALLVALYVVGKPLFSVKISRLEYYSADDRSAASTMGGISPCCWVRAHAIQRCGTGTLGFQPQHSRLSVGCLESNATRIMRHEWI